MPATEMATPECGSQEHEATRPQTERGEIEGKDEAEEEQLQETREEATSSETSSLGDDDEYEQYDSVVDLLPTELLCHILSMLPFPSVAPAARTCRRWYACSHRWRRRTFSMRWVFSSVAALQYARLDQRFPPWRHLYFATEICLHCAKKGRLAVLQWLRENGLLLGWPLETCALAAANGHYDLVKWATEHGYPFV